MELRSYQELIAWKKAIALVTSVYGHTQGFPREEVYGITSQMRRAGVSIPSNIAEGYGRNSRGEFRQFLGNARGSLYELETQTIIASQLGFLPEAAIQDLLSRIAEVSRILGGLIRSIENRNSSYAKEEEADYMTIDSGHYTSSVE